MDGLTLPVIVLAECVYHSWRLTIPNWKANVDNIVTVKVLNGALNRNILLGNLLFVASRKWIGPLNICGSIGLLRNDFKKISTALLNHITF